jgi:RNA polymerase sigma-54 factor
MTLGPRLEFRQSQSLVMTPQLRQAIKLLQLNNLEAAAFVEEELERNPLLERDERTDTFLERPGIDQPEALVSPTADTAELASSATLPADGAAPLDTETDGYDAFGAADGVRLPSGAAPGATGEDDWDYTERIESRSSLRDHLAEQMRLNFDTREARLIGAYLIALLDPAGRLSAAPADIAHHLGTSCEAVELVRRRMMQFDPVGMFARTLAECLAAQLLERNRLDPAMVALLDNLDLFGRRDFRRLMSACSVDWDDLQEMMSEIRALDPKPGAGWDVEPLPPIVPDVLMRKLPGGDFVLELNPDTLPRVLVNETLYARVGRQVARQAGHRELAGEVPPAARANHPQGFSRNRAAPGRLFPPRRLAPEAADPARHCRDGIAARKHCQPRDRQQIHRHPARKLRIKIFLYQRHCRFGR